MGVLNNVERLGKIMSKYMTILIIGALGQFTIMPIVAFLVCKLMNLPPEISIGVILVGCCPGGISSNVMSFIAKGDVALSVSLTTVSTLIALIVTPALTLILAGSYIDVSLYSMFLSTIKIVLIPIIVGILCNKYLPKVSEVTEKCIPMLSSLSLMCLVAGVTSNSLDNLKTTGVLLFVAVIIHNVFGHLLGYILAYKFGMDEEKRRVVSLEVGMQNTGLATTLAVSHFSLLAALPAAISGTWQTIFSAVLANYWSKKSEEKEIELDVYSNK